jgi:hypothetical protein
LFDAQVYFGRVNRMLETHRDRYTIETTDINVAPENDWEDWYFISWNALITFCTGHKLSVSESYSRGSGLKIHRALNYHFMDEENKCIFRFDTHGREWPIETPCHIHLGEDEQILEQNDQRLNTLDLANIDFLSAFQYAFGYAIDNRGFPWD